MSSRVEFIEDLFTKLTLRYGHAFLARWRGMSLEAVKADWSQELASYGERREAIEYALALLDPDEAPTAARFRELCASAPVPVSAFRAEPEPKEPQRAAEIRRKYLRPVPPRAGRERAWATDMVQRAQAGERVSGYSLRLALDALGQSRLTRR